MFTKSFLLSALEKAIVVGASTFTASDFLNKSFTLHGFEQAAAAAGIAVVYTFVKNLGFFNAIKASKAAAK